MPRAKTEWTVRVINFEGRGRLGTNDELPGLWVEQLRYMGHVIQLAELENPPRTVLEFYAPRGVDSQIWAKHNADRMSSFGINAAAAPKWADVRANSGMGVEDYNLAKKETPRD